MPRRVQTALAKYASKWATLGIRAWEEGWWEMPITCGNRSWLPLCPARPPPGTGTHRDPLGRRPRATLRLRPDPIEYAPEINRYLNGTANVLPIRPTRSSYEIVNQIGVPAICARSIRQILIDFRPGAGVPIAPHFYPADHKLDHAIRELKSILQS